MNSRIKNKTQLVLTLLYAGVKSIRGEQDSIGIEGITRLEKLLFLLKMEKGFLEDAENVDNFHYIPFKMGPWTNEVYDEIDFLESLGLVEKKQDKKKTPADIAYVNELLENSLLDKYQKNTYSNNKGTDLFSLTTKGKEKAIDIWNNLSDFERENLIEIKRKFNNMNLNQLLRYVYNKYPEYSKESEIRDALGLI